MAKFVWDVQHLAKYNCSMMGKFYINSKEVEGKHVVYGIQIANSIIPVIVELFHADSLEQAKMFIDGLTESDVDKYAGPLMATFMQYVQSLMPGVKGNA